MIKNFIFDLGNVIVDFNPQDMTRKYVSDEINLKKVSEAAFSRKIFDKLDSGEFTDEDGRNYIKNTVDRSILEQTLLTYDNWMDNLKPIEGIKELIEDIKSRGYKIYLLSNVTGGFKQKYSEIEAVYDILKNFDGLVISGEIKMVKPNLEIYEYILKRFDLKAQECIFIDDKKENTDAAIKCNMSAYTFKADVKELKKYIKKEIY